MSEQQLTAAVLDQVLARLLRDTSVGGDESRSQPRYQCLMFESLRQILAENDVEAVLEILECFDDRDVNLVFKSARYRGCMYALLRTRAALDL